MRKVEATSTTKRSIIPEMPPKTPEEQEASLRIRETLALLTAQNHTHNLANAILLAQQAACGHGPLVDHFAELGRRYVHLLAAPPGRGKTNLRLVDEGHV